MAWTEQNIRLTDILGVILRLGPLLDMTPSVGLGNQSFKKAVKGLVVVIVLVVTQMRFDESHVRA